MNGALRLLLPREHGLWCWCGAPLGLALLLAPSGATALGALGLGALLGAANAARARAGRLAGGVGALGLLLCILAGQGMAGPVLWALLVGLVVLGAVGVLLATRRATGRQIAGHTAYELLTIAGFAFIGAGAAAAAGAPPQTALALAGALLTWELVGLWWLRRALAAVLPGRGPWPGGLLLIGLALLLNLGLALGADAPALAALPLLYGLRAGLTAAPTSPRDARRLGLSEAAWTGGYALLAVAVVGALP